jgi:predicted nucleotidyltransferase
MFTWNQMQVLAVLVANPETELFMSEIGEAMGKRPGVFQRGINALEHEGYVTSRRRGNQRLFRINDRHPLFREVKSIVQKTSGVEGSLRTLVNWIPDVNVALIYGSYAKDSMRPDSDIDLLVVCGAARSEDILLKKIAVLERGLHREINYKFYLAEEFRKCHSVDPFLREVLNGKYILLKGTV